MRQSEGENYPYLIANFNVISLLKSPIGHFYTPVFRRDVLWYGDVRPSGSPSVRPSVRHSFPHFSPTCFDILIWNFVYHFIFMYVRSSSNAFNFRQLFAGVMPLFNFKLLQICSFPHFSPSYFDISSWNLAYDFVLLYYRTSSSVDDFRQLLLDLCPFCNFEYWKYTSFPHFSLTRFDILELKFCVWLLFYRTTDQVQCCQFPSIFVGVMPFWT